MTLVTKVKDKAGGLYGQAKAKYAASDTIQKAGLQAGKTAGQVASRLRDMTGKAASGQMAGKVRELPGKATAAVKDARARRLAHR